MPVSQQAAPRNFRIPAVTVDTRLRIDNPVADTGDLLLLAPKGGTGAGIVDTIYPIANENECVRVFGKGSIGHRMFRAWQAQAPFAAVQMYCLDDEGTKRVVNVNFTGSVTTAGVIRLTVGSDVIQIPVTASQTAAQVATAVDTALGDFSGALPFTADINGTDTSQVDLTAINGGEVNNTAGVVVDVSEVGGIAVTVANGTAGSGNYSYAAPWKPTLAIACLT